MARGTPAASHSEAGRHGARSRISRIQPAIPHALVQKHPHARPQQLQHQVEPESCREQVHGESHSSTEYSPSTTEQNPLQPAPDIVTRLESPIDLAANVLVSLVVLAADDSKDAKNKGASSYPVRDLRTEGDAHLGVAADLGEMATPSQNELKSNTGPPSAAIPVPQTDHAGTATLDISHHQSHPSSVATLNFNPMARPTTADQTDGVRREPNNLVFGGHRDSGASSPRLSVPQTAFHTPSFTSLFPPSSMVPLIPHVAASDEATPIQHISSVPTVSSGDGRQSSRVHESTKPDSMWPTGGSYRGHASKFGPSHSQYLPSISYPPPARPEGFGPVPHFTTMAAQSFTDARIEHDYGRGPVPYDHARHTAPYFRHPYRSGDDELVLPTAIGGPGLQLFDAESQFRRPSGIPVQNLHEDSASMASYVHGQFGNREFCDYIIHLSHTLCLFPPVTVPAHGIILARSPKLRSLMRIQNGDQRSPQTHPKFLTIACSDRFLTHELAFLRAVMRLYGEPLPEAEMILKLPCPPMLANLEGIRFALSYAAAGHFLQVDEIITYGLDLATQFLAWDTIAIALAFSLDGGLSPSFTAFEGPAEDKASNASSFDDAPARLDSDTSMPAYGIYSDRMMHHVVNFVAQSCPQDFQLCCNVAQLPEIARLPAVAEPSKDTNARTQSPASAASVTTKQLDRPGLQSRSDSRLSQIRFGDMAPSADNMASTPPPAPLLADIATAVMSSILLTIPFTLLKYLFEATPLSRRLGPPRAAEVARALVTERERRRMRATAHRTATGQAPHFIAEEKLWRNARWVEGIELVSQGQTGIKFVRHLGDVETPRSRESQASGDGRT